jgi:hypothetical protein
VYQDELVYYLPEEWNVYITRQNILKILKEATISCKRGQRMEPSSMLFRNEQQADTLNCFAEQMAVMNECLFKKQSCWRTMACAPIGHPARYREDITRSET